MKKIVKTNATIYKDSSSKFIISLFLVIIISGYRLFAQVNYRDSDRNYVKPTGTLLTGLNMDFPVAVRLPGYINSAHIETGPLIAPDGKTIYFSRQHYPICNSVLFGYEDIWYSTFNDTTNMWNRPVNIGPPIVISYPNSLNILRISPDTILFSVEYKSNGKVTDGIAMSTRQGNEWTFPQAVGIDFQTSSGDDNVFLTPHRKVILTSGQRDDSFGGLDIYVTLFHPDGKTETKNLGSVINTGEDETSPFLADDNKTLYFASKGHTGFGGYDIFVSQRLDDTWQNWSEPVNLGPSVNTDKDEEFFKLSVSGQYAYFSRQVSHRNTDIFQISMPGKQQALLSNH